MSTSTSKIVLTKTLSEERVKLSLKNLFGYKILRGKLGKKGTTKISLL
jgi:hypothetical protein